MDILEILGVFTLHPIPGVFIEHPRDPWGFHGIPQGVPRDPMGGPWGPHA